MQKLIRGVQRFQSRIFQPQHDRFQELLSGQHPEALFIGCSDSRVPAETITQTNPGELFVLRNAGNIVPSYGVATGGGEAATIEYAVEALQVKEIIICGHTRCGAMNALLHPEQVERMPLVASWLQQAEATRRIAAEYRAEREGEPVDNHALLDFTVEQNVLVQIENLRTHPSVLAALRKGRVRIHGWVFRLDTGMIDAFDPDDARFVPLEEARTDGPFTPAVRIPVVVQ